MDEKRVWVLKKTGSFVDCDVLGRAAASDVRTTAGGALNMPTKSQRIFIYRPTIR